MTAESKQEGPCFNTSLDLSVLLFFFSLTVLTFSSIELESLNCTQTCLHVSLCIVDCCPIEGLVESRPTVIRSFLEGVISNTHMTKCLVSEYQYSAQCCVLALLGYIKVLTDAAATALSMFLCLVKLTPEQFNDLRCLCFST